MDNVPTLPSLIATESVSPIGLYTREYVDDLTDNHLQYTHIISAVSGFDTASFAITGDESYLTDWFNEAVLRKILYINPQGIPTWEGYVQKAAFSKRGVTKTRNIDTVYNRVYLQYSPLRFSNGTVTSEDPVTIIVDNLESQTELGIVKATVVNGGELEDETAFTWANVILNDKSKIQTGEAINTANTAKPGLKLECLGYHHSLKWLPYINSDAVLIQSHQVIQEILRYFAEINPNWISTDFSFMDYNFRTDRRDSSDFKTCWQLIFGNTGIIARGGLGGQRWVGGFYQNRKMIYKPAEDFSGFYGDDLFYYRSANDLKQRIYEEGTGVEVHKWDILPDRILRTTDLI